ncbi:MAG: sigma-70 family RNA polymerase sigma factor [Planctomycetota bacterium]
MNHNAADVDRLLKLAQRGDQAALHDLLERFRPQLKMMVRMRLNPRLKARVDDSDVVQDAFLYVSKRLPDYIADPQSPFLLWLRQITSRKLIDVHRKHLGANTDAGREVSLNRARFPQASSICIAEHLADGQTSPSGIVLREETRAALDKALTAMDETDREVISMRHYEGLSNIEVAHELGIESAAASKRYVRALQRLQKILTELGIDAASRGKP